MVKLTEMFLINEAESTAMHSRKFEDIQNILREIEDTVAEWEAYPSSPSDPEKEIDYDMQNPGHRVLDLIEDLKKVVEHFAPK